MKKFILITILVLILAGIIYLFYNAYANKVQCIKDLEARVNKEGTQLAKLKVTKDSLQRINFFLSRYRGLTDAMFYRDSLRIPLKYKIGDRVYLKRDSSKVTITDVVIGGSQYDFYVKYKVLFKDKSTEEVIPELIY